ncbi:MAG: hypothetical protein JKY50_12570 [Oleispira sp.]|nr:hypothetical protein [Oleispira sp.]MBL4882610.1 hypothetical protein [Oleispira sp.]
MKKILAKKQMLLSLILGFVTLIFTSLSFSYDPGLKYLPGRDDGATGAINEAQQGCVYRESDASLGSWTVDDCDYVGAHYACYNGAEWKVAQALGTAVNSGEPRDGDASSDPKVKAIDLWDPIKADGLCKDYFGPAYFFSVPVNADEDANLGAAISTLVAAKKRTWLFYYSNTQDIPLAKNYWLGNRTEYTNWFGNSPDNKSTSAGTADCTLIHRDTGLWQDVSCSEEHSFACYESGNWLITGEQGEWRSGFSVCDENYSALSIYGVPRDNSENDELKAALLPALGSGNAADYNQVWLNRTDLAFEEFFISNQTRRAWWGAGQPTNRNNADCTLIDSAGNWISEPCNGYVAYHACYLGDNSSGQAQWQLTSSIADLKESEFSLGFGHCKQLSDNAEYRPPNSTASNTALSSLLATGEFVWINYSDQESEGAWKVASQYQDFVSFSDVIDGDAKDCGYFSLETNDKGNWLEGQCYAGGASMEQGFACTNGYEWKVATAALSDGSSLTSDLWKDGFTACEAAFGVDYHFAAPSGADQNSRLSLALSLSGNTQAWMNLNDAKTEGEWIANGPVVNLSPVLTLSSEREFNEKEVINLSVAALDPETGNNIGLIYQWSIIAQRVGDNGGGSDIITAPTLTNENTDNLTLSAIDLLNDNYYLDIQLQVTDADAGTPATTTSVITIKIISPLLAAYDFNEYTNPKLDSSGNGHHLILNTSEVEITARDNGLNDYFAKMDAADSFSIDGSVAGLQLDPVRDQYTITYRFKMDAISTDPFAGFVQKGIAGSRQPAIFYYKAENKIHFSNTTVEDPFEGGVSQEEVRLGQWMTVAYVKNGEKSWLYIDKAELKSDPDPDPLNVIPDTTAADLTGVSTGYDSGDWIFGSMPDAAEGIVGGFDDIRIYNRSLTAVELNKIFSDQPKGVFEFVNELEVGDENEVENSVTEVSIPVSRMAGDDGIVSVAYSLKSDSAILDEDFKLKDDPKTIGDPERGKGVLTWQVHDAADKNIVVELIGDNLREGTESFTIELEKLAAEPSLGSNGRISINVIDKTPNPYGTIAMAPTTLTENIPVDEGDSGLITVERVGTDSLGAFDVIYQIEALSAASPEDFSITQAGFPIAGTMNGSVLGQGRLSFPANAGAPVDKQIQTISFSTVAPDGFESDEVFTVTLIAVTDPGSSTLAAPNTSAILGTKRGYSQVINDITPGRISFKQANYSADEVEQGAGSNVVVVSLARQFGDDGAMCVTLDMAGSTAGTLDYSIAYLDSSASGQDDVFWADQDSADKSVLITIVNDQMYDPSETIELVWVHKANCNSVATVVPDLDAGDIASTTLSISDQTTPVSVKFSATSYSVSERGTSLLVTIQATQGSDFSAGNRTNKNAFSIYLNPSDESAFEGTDFDDLAGLKVVNFTATGAGATEQFVNIQINDNCDAGAAKQFSMSLLKVHGDLPVTLPVELIDVSSTNATVEITDAMPAFSVSTAVDTLGVTNAASVLKSRYRVTSAGGNDNDGFSPRNLKLSSVNNTGDGCSLNYEWAYTGSTPVLPKAGIGKSSASLPGAFSTPPLADLGTSPSSIQFTLPFVIEDTALNYSLTVTHPEQAQPLVINDSIPIGAYWMRLINYGPDECLIASGSSINLSGCGAATASNFTYNQATKKIVGEATLGAGASERYACLTNRGYTECDASADGDQEFFYELQTSNPCDGKTFIIRGGSTYHTWFGSLQLDGSPGTSTCNSRDWDWTGTP